MKARRVPWACVSSGDDHSGYCDEQTAALQRAYDAGQPDAFARGFAAGIERALGIAQRAVDAAVNGIQLRAAKLTRDRIDCWRTSPAAAPVATENPSHRRVRCHECGSGVGVWCIAGPGLSTRFVQGEWVHAVRIDAFAAAPVEPPKETTP